MKTPLSVFIITKNEAHNLPYCLEAIHDLADEIIIVDSGSSDATQEVAESYGAKFYFKAFEGFGQQKLYAESLCRNSWVLNLDADEVVPLHTIAEIKTFLSFGRENKDGVRIKVVSLYPHQVRPRFLADCKDHVRLYNKEVLHFSSHPSHDVVEIKNNHRIDQLKNIILHYSFSSLSDLEEKKKRRTRFYFEVEKPGQKWKNQLRYPIEYPFTFFKTYILRRHFTGGAYGVKLSLLQAKYRHLRIKQRLKGRCLVDD